FRLAESPALSTFEAEVQNRPGSDHQHEHGQDGEPNAMGPLAAGPLFLDHRQSAGFEQRLPADSAPAHFRSPGPFRCGLALMVPRHGTAHVYLAPILRFGFFQKRNLDDAATFRTGSALARKVSAQADFLVAKGALKIDGLSAGGGGRRWGFGLLRQRGQGLTL